ncbi:MAG TPA: flagellar biosynthesis anti-sigma factor FlgM [Arsenophonus sp.]
MFTLRLSGSTEKLLQSNVKDIREQKVEQIQQKIENGKLMFMPKKSLTR